MNCVHRFFINRGFLAGEVVRITGSDYNHISRSLRLNPGEEIIVTTGDGWEYLVKISAFGSGAVEGRIVEKKENHSEPPLSITLAQAIPKKNKLDLIIEKSTELGIKRIIPLITGRTIVRVREKREGKKLLRWQRMAEEAAKQSQRGMIPIISDVAKLQDLAAITGEFDLILLAWVGEKQNNLRKVRTNADLAKVSNILMIIGPEGGFSHNEVEFVRNLGGIPISLGPRVLRTETAALTLLALLLYEFGDLGGTI